MKNSGNKLGQNFNREEQLAFVQQLVSYLERIPIGEWKKVDKRKSKELEFYFSSINNAADFWYFVFNEDHTQVKRKQL